MGGASGFDSPARDCLRGQIRPWSSQRAHQNLRRTRGGSLPDFYGKPYHVQLTYYDAIGTAHRTHRIGYLFQASDFRLEEWDHAEADSVQLV